MQVAVFVDALHLVIRHEREGRLGLVARLELLALVAVLGLDGDPLDAVGVRHRMLDRADLHRDRVAAHRVDGHVLFNRSVRRSRDKFAHRLAAADRVDVRRLDHRDNLAANIALVEFHVQSSVSSMNAGGAASDLRLQREVQVAHPRRRRQRQHQPISPHTTRNPTIPTAAQTMMLFMAHLVFSFRFVLRNPGRSSHPAESAFPPDAAHYALFRFRCLLEIQQK